MCVCAPSLLCLTQAKDAMLHPYFNDFPERDVGEPPLLAWVAPFLALALVSFRACHGAPMWSRVPPVPFKPAPLWTPCPLPRS